MISFGGFLFGLVFLFCLCLFFGWLFSVCLLVCFQAANNHVKTRPGGLTIHAGLVERRRGVKRRVHLGAVGQQHFDALDAPRGTGVAERGAAINIPGIHLQGRTKTFGTRRLLRGRAL